MNQEHTILLCCKNCAYYTDFENDLTTCLKLEVQTVPGAFCSYYQRKENNEPRSKEG